MIIKRQEQQRSGQKGSTALQNTELAQHARNERTGPRPYSAMSTPVVQQLSKTVQEGLSHLPADVAAGQSATAIFYDPIASRESDAPAPARLSTVAGTARHDRRRREAAKGRHVTRAESIEAVAGNWQHLP
jgi:hypothetical protein